jgi:hypothetical protein
MISRYCFGKYALFVAALLFGTVALAASHEKAEQEAEQPSGTVEIEGKELKLILGGASGSGVLRFQGKEYAFKAGGITVGGVGYTELSASGNVYNLTDVSQFPGTFSQFQAGATVGKGMGGLTLINENDVRMELRSSSEGVGLSLGAGGIQITMQ